MNKHVELTDYMPMAHFQTLLHDQLVCELKSPEVQSWVYIDILMMTLALVDQYQDWSVAEDAVNARCDRYLVNWYAQGKTWEQFYLSPADRAFRIAVDFIFNARDVIKGHSLEQDLNYHRR